MHVKIDHVLAFKKKLNKQISLEMYENKEEDRPCYNNWKTKKGDQSVHDI